MRALEKHGLKPGDGEVLVTGAAGGVGSIAVAILAGMGYTVVASTGRPAEADYLKGLGAARIIDRAELSGPGKPLQAERWAGVVDTVGSHTLANACAPGALVRRGGRVRAGAGLGSSRHRDALHPARRDALRHQQRPGTRTRSAARPGTSSRGTSMRRKLEAMTGEIGLSEVIAFCPSVLEGKVRGRTVVDVNR